jgi:hypothetical protein
LTIFWICWKVTFYSRRRSHGTVIPFDPWTQTSTRTGLWGWGWCWGHFPLPSIIQVFITATTWFLISHNFNFNYIKHDINNVNGSRKLIFMKRIFFFFFFLRKLFHQYNCTFEKFQKFQFKYKQDLLWHEQMWKLDLKKLNKFLFRTPYSLKHSWIFPFYSLLFFIIGHYHLRVLQLQMVIKLWTCHYKQLILAMESPIWNVAYLQELSSAFCRHDETAILWRVAYCCWPTIHQRCMLCCESSSVGIC